MVPRLKESSLCNVAIAEGFFYFIDRHAVAGIAFSITERKETMKEQLEKIKSEALARIEASDALETLMTFG